MKAIIFSYNFLAKAFVKILIL